MPSIVFNGPNPLDPTNPTMVTTTVDVETNSFLVTVQALCVNYGYQPTITSWDMTDPNNPRAVTIANPIGPGNFAIQQILNFCRDNVASYIANQAISTAQQTAATNLASYVVPTV